MIGMPLTIDMATFEIFKPSIAKVCVQIDLLKELTLRVWLKCGDVISDFW